jgi:sulfatase maturation enzyme AslB (radical SAM superfamily)
MQLCILEILRWGDRVTEQGFSVNAIGKFHYCQDEDNLRGDLPTPPIDVMIKPVSGNCSLNCKYCFYRDISENRDEKSYGVMSEDTLEALVKKHLNMEKSL